MPNAMNNYPMHYPKWAETALQTTIELYSSYNLENGPQENSILLIGGVHGDEPEGVHLAQCTLDWLRSLNPNKVRPWLLIPCINPDGFSKGQRTNSNLVDLNRNFPSRCWSPEFTKDRYNPGPTGGSEKETKSLVALIEAQKPKFIIHCHSYDPCVVYTGMEGKEIAELLAHSSGYPAQATIGYDCPGSLGDYAYDDHGIPVICIEADHGASLDIVWPRFRQGIEQTFLLAEKK